MASKLMSGPSVVCWASMEPVSPADSARCCRPMPAPPKIANQMVETPEGTTSTPAMNWRTERPREMRAMNRPTKGAHETHQAQ